jgi:hypothetical protein
MVVLKHELWRSPDGLTGLCLSGPMGDSFHSLLETDSKLVQIIEGSSHYDVMTKYYKIMGWGEYTTEFQRDYEPYPDEWRTIQDPRSS